MTEIREHDQQNAVRLAQEKDLLAGQIQNLEREVEQLKKAAEEFEGFRNFWKNRAEERAAQNRKPPANSYQSPEKNPRAGGATGSSTTPTRRSRKPRGPRRCRLSRGRRTRRGTPLRRECGERPPPGSTPRQQRSTTRRQGAQKHPKR
ncbi:unnamed protein product [Nippostrongylus brasiliensis]|uniref:Transposase n=1 Tax=Nippostrongylus brasiliensis TaxID=27835 RepID=A0A0N4Y5J6_NIPBR|nr:hypothetical protein Q1695_008762 [Nippostrongylus brasiliensis]VDL74865.1 unnamed protein product [Nippostrongylus brasiliensis]